jgi:DNA-binding MarR family transcriptional regulator
MQSNDELVAALRRWTGALMRRNMQDFVLFSRKSGITPPQIGALFRIDKGGVNVSDLGGDLGITSAAASQMLQRLVQQQLIVRTEDTEDRRVKRMALTAKGRKILQEYMQIRNRWMDDLASALSDREKDQVANALNMLVDRAEKLDGVAEVKR